MTSVERRDLLTACESALIEYCREKRHKFSCSITPCNCGFSLGLRRLAAGVTRHEAALDSDEMFLDDPTPVDDPRGKK